MSVAVWLAGGGGVSVTSKTQARRSRQQAERRPAVLLQRSGLVAEGAGTRKIIFTRAQKTFDVQMIMIIIERNRSRDWLVTLKP